MNRDYSNFVRCVYTNESNLSKEEREYLSYWATSQPYEYQRDLDRFISAESRKERNQLILVKAKYCLIALIVSVIVATVRYYAGVDYRSASEAAVAGCLMAWFAMSVTVFPYIENMMKAQI